MSSIFGYTGKQDGLTNMADVLRHWQPDREQFFVDENISFGVLELFKTPECPNTPQPLKKDRLQVMLDGRIDNRVALCADLSIDVNTKEADVFFVALAYQKYGVHCFNKLEGDFAIAIYNEETQELILARDKMGVKPLFYTQQQDTLVFASEIKGILAINNDYISLNERQVVAYFSALQPKIGDTMYNNISKLPPATWLKFSNGKIELEKYWEIGGNAPSVPQSIKNAEAKFNKLFRESVQKRLRTYRKLGAEVSGGLDSTGIAAVAMEELGNGADFYSYCYGKPKSSYNGKLVNDDVDLVREFCKKYGVGKNLTVTNETDIDARQIIELSSKIIDEVDMNGVPTFTTSFLPKAIKSDVGVMLSGWAGDQMVTNTCGGFSEALAIQGKYKELWKDISDRHGGIKLLLNFIRFVVRSKTKPFYKVNFQNAQKQLEISGLSAKTIQKYKLDEMVGFRYFLKSQTNLKDYQKWNMFHFGINDRTVHHGLWGKHFRVDYRFPMLDVPLLEFIHQLPLKYVAPKGKTRYLFKQLIKSKVPDGVIDLHKSRVSTTPFAETFFYKNDQLLKTTAQELIASVKTESCFDFTKFAFEKQKRNLLKYIQVINKAQNYEILKK